MNGVSQNETVLKEALQTAQEKFTKANEAAKKIKQMAEEKINE